MTGVLDRAIGVAALLSPVFLLHGRGIAEACVDVAAIGFLGRSAVAGAWEWLRIGWVRVAALWWGWLLLCSLPVGPLGAGGWPAFGQAFATVRFLVFVAALQCVALFGERERSWMRGLLCAAVLYIAGQMGLQAIIGRNLWGQPRFHDGTLTGPYGKPRAAAPLSRLLLPVVLRAAAGLAKRRRGALLAALPLLAGAAAMVLAGQRMPLLLFLLGLLVAGIMLPRLRPVLAGVVVLAPVLVAVSAVLTPASFHHLVLLFARQMEHFRQSSYGLVFARAAAMGWREPWTGLGFDGFRHACANPDFFRSWPPWAAGSGSGSSPGLSDGGGAAICVQHPHNHYLQALTDAGIPGLMLFCATVWSWLLAAGRGLLRPASGPDMRRRAWRVGLFAAVFIQEWPIASTSAFTNMPLGGWFFLILGMALAEADADMRGPDPAHRPVAAKGTKGVAHV
ncbi:MAG: O-antigen ligase family protein [Gluconacetobacter diazotrophicus]|nr:O-antigen ligase family protein [Gluconacetobacter diazotrophicus]